MGLARDARDLNMAAAYGEQARAARRTRHAEDAAMIQTEADRRASEVLGDTGGALAPNSLHHRVQMERRIEAGAPKFNHALHLALTLFTGGFWSIGWVVMWLRSPRRRYLKWRRMQLQHAGLY